MSTTPPGAAYAALTALLAPFFALLALVTAAALRGARPAAGGGTAAAAAAPPRFLIVVPAHDEEAGVGAAVAGCRAVAYDPDRFAVLVVADNCADGTAAAARAAGAGVLERTDPARPGKGFALEDALRHLADSGALGRFDAAVVVDADTRVDPGLLAALAPAVAAGCDWAQGYYSVRNPDASWRTRLMTYALGLFNGVWPLGEDRLGLGAGLRGNGMCLSVRGLARHPWRAAGLAEDLEFAWSLRLAGERVRFIPGARVYGEMVSRGAAAAPQRRRWEQGRRALPRRFLRPLLASRTFGPVRTALAVVDLLFPPLTALALLFLAALSVHPLARLAPGLGLGPASRALAPWHALMAAAAAAYAAAPFVVVGLPPRYLASLAAAPYYAAWKLALAAVSRGRSAAWERTHRESEAPAGPARGGPAG